MEKNVTLLPPTMPNFVTMQRHGVKKQDGLDLSRGTFPITDFTEEEAIEYGELMKQAFIEHWKSKKV